MRQKKKINQKGETQILAEENGNENLNLA